MPTLTKLSLCLALTSLGACSENADLSRRPGAASPMQGAPEQPALERSAAPLSGAADKDTARNPAVEHASTATGGPADESLAAQHSLARAARPASSVARTARAELKSPAGTKLGHATLQERSEGVELSLELGGATPGPRLVELRATGSCSEPKADQRAVPQQPGAHEAKVANLGLGALEVDQRGAGKLQVTMPDRSLAHGAPDSLLGHALAVYPSKGKTDATSWLACAQILAE